MHELVDFLRSRGMRCFRSYRDDAYFFVVDCVYPGDPAAYRGRLFVNLQVGEDGAIQVTATPDRFYPADVRTRLAAVAAAWDPGGAHGLDIDTSVHESSDPTRVGATVVTRACPVGLTAATEFVERAVACAIELFGRLNSVAPARSAPVGPASLADAG